MERQVVARTPRLALTSWLPSDVDDLSEVHSDAETMRFVRSGRPESRAETAALVEGYIAEHARRGWTKWRLADAGGRLVGRAGFGAEGAGRELGYTIRRDLWGLGLATEVAAALVDWHHAHAPAVDLIAWAAVENTASHRVLAKVGFHPTGSRDVHGVPCHLFRLPEAASTPV